METYTYLISNNQISILENKKVIETYILPKKEKARSSLIDNVSKTVNRLNNNGYILSLDRKEQLTNHLLFGNLLGRKYDI